eukprot:6204980-Pleurochrysis_carterae.AAC.1
MRAHMDRVHSLNRVTENAPESATTPLGRCRHTRGQCTTHPCAPTARANAPPRSAAAAGLHGPDRPIQAVQ